MSSLTLPTVIILHHKYSVITGLLTLNKKISSELLNYERERYDCGDGLSGWRWELMVEENSFCVGDRHMTWTVAWQCELVQSLWLCRCRLRDHHSEEGEMQTTRKKVITRVLGLPQTPVYVPHIPTHRKMRTSAPESPTRQLNHLSFEYVFMR